MPAEGLLLPAKNQRLAPVAVGLACLGGWSAMILENGHSQEQAPGITPENLGSPVTAAAELSPENMELLAGYSCPGGRAAAARPVVTSGTYL